MLKQQLVTLLLVKLLVSQVSLILVKVFRLKMIPTEQLFLGVVQLFLLHQLLVLVSNLLFRLVLHVSFLVVVQSHQSKLEILDLDTELGFKQFRLVLLRLTLVSQHLSISALQPLKMVRLLQ